MSLRTLGILAAILFTSTALPHSADAARWSTRSTLRAPATEAPAQTARATRAERRAGAPVAARAAATAASIARGGHFVVPAGATAIPDGAGGTYVAWSTDRDGPFDVYLQRVTNAGNVASGWPAAGLPVCTAEGMQLSAGMISDGANGVIVGWSDFRNKPFNFASGSDLYVQRVNAAGVPQWTANGVMAISGASPEGDLSASSDGSGGAFLVWTVGFPADVYANRVNGSGVIPAGWNVAGVPVCTDPDDQFGPVVSPDGSGGAYITWTDDRTAQNEVFAQRLNAAGAEQWTADGINLTNGADGQTPGICPDGAGGAQVFWASSGNIKGQRLNSAGAAQWAAGGVNVGTGGFGLNEVWAWQDPAGGAYLAWHDDAISTTLYAQRVNAAGATQWTAAGVSVCAASGGRFIEDGYAEAGGGLTLLWEDTRASFDRDLYAQKLNATGVPQWTANGVALCTDPSDQEPLGIATDGAGGVVGVWVDDRNTDPEAFVQRLNSAGVAQLTANGKSVLPDPGLQRSAIAIPDGAGGTWSVWEEKADSVYHIRARRLDSTGTPVTSSITVCGVAAEQLVAGAVSDGAGGVIIGWSDNRNGEFDIYAQRLSAAAAALWTANGVVVCNAAQNQLDPGMVSDGAGSAILAWSDPRTGAADIYAQRLNPANGAGMWAANGAVVCNAASQQTSPVLAPAGTNAAVIAWIDSRTFGSDAIYAQRLNGAGVAQWAANGVMQESVPPFSTRCVDAISDGADGAIVLYESTIIDFFTFAFTTTDLRAMRVSSAGSSQWAAGGVPMSTLDAHRFGAGLISDNAGGMIAAWADARSGKNDIYAQRVNSAGAVQWAADGAVVCNNTSWQWISGMVPDGSGGAVITWADERSGFADIYAQRVNSAGAAQWTANGVVVANAPRGQYGAATHPAASGAAVLVWTDYRSGTERLAYAQKINSAGAAQWTVNGVTATLMSLVSAEATRDRVRMTWLVSDGSPVTAYRSVGANGWASLGTLLPDGNGRVTLDDSDVTPGVRYGYRLGVMRDGVEAFSQTSWIEVPSTFALAIDGVRPQPARGEMWFAFSLASDAPARLEVLDVAGRRVSERNLAGLGAGRHVIQLDAVPDRGGMYFLRLTQAGESVMTKAVRLD